MVPGVVFSVDHLLPVLTDDDVSSVTTCCYDKTTLLQGEACQTGNRLPDTPNVYELMS